MQISIAPLTSKESVCFTPSS